MAATEHNTSIRQIWPLLAVQDMGRAVRFYRNQLGFAVAGRAESDGEIFWCRVERDGLSVMLQKAEAEDGPPEGRGRGISLYFVCEDADAMYRELSGRGLKLEPPSEADYGMKQLLVPEPDGYSICFESPTSEWAG